MICWIHGAFSTSRSFNYLKDFVSEPSLDYSYSVRKPLTQNLDELCDLLEANPCRALIGHSLGGVLAILAKRRLGIEKVITLASPLGGTNVALLAPVTQLLVDLHPYGETVKEMSRHTYDDSLLSIIATGNDDIPLSGDGVVSLASQRRLCGNQTVEIAVNHFEILLDDTVGKLISDYLA